VCEACPQLPYSPRRALEAEGAQAFVW